MYDKIIDNRPPTIDAFDAANAYWDNSSRAEAEEIQEEIDELYAELETVTTQAERKFLWKKINLRINLLP